MQILERKEYLSSIVGHALLDCAIKLPDLAQKGAPLNVLQLEVQILLVLKTAVNVHEKWALRSHVEVGVVASVLELINELFVAVAQVLKHFTLVYHVVHMLHASHALLFQHLKGADSVVFFV